jgi:hypothetical protein
MALTDPSSDLQDAITAALAQNEDIVSLVADRIFDRISDAPTFPYISLGDTQVLPETGEQTDAAQSFITIHTWDRFEGFGAVKRLGKLVVATLHDEPLTISDGSVQSMLLDSARYLRDPDGLTSHGVLTFAILTDANS